MKDEVGGVIKNKFVSRLGLYPKLYSCLKDDDKEEKVKGTKNCIIKRR